MGSEERIYAQLSSRRTSTPSPSFRSSIVSSTIMRAIVLLGLLHAVFAQDLKFSWNGPVPSAPTSAPDLSMCSAGPEACGCCLMQKQINRLETLVNKTVQDLGQELAKAKLGLNNMRASRSAFSAALNNGSSLSCLGPFAADKVIQYKHIFINLGSNYNAVTGIFTAPRSGVYSFAVTIYSVTVSPQAQTSCAKLQVNGNAVAQLIEKNGADIEDSNTVVAALQLEAGDQVAASLLPGCNICDNFNHFNTFTGFLLY